jgi:hypothetical protein
MRGWQSDYGNKGASEMSDDFEQFRRMKWAAVYGAAVVEQWRESALRGCPADEASMRQWVMEAATLATMAEEAAEATHEPAEPV